MSSIRGAFDTFKPDIEEIQAVQEYSYNWLVPLCVIAIGVVGFLLGVLFSTVEFKSIRTYVDNCKNYLWRKRLELPIKKPYKVKQSPFPSPMRLPMTHMEAKKLEERTATITNHRVRKESVSYQPLNVNDEYRITLYAVLEEMPAIKV